MHFDFRGKQLLRKVFEQIFLSDFTTNTNAFLPCPSTMDSIGTLCNFFFAEGIDFHFGKQT